MSGLLRRIRRTRPPAQEPAPDPGAARDETEQTTGDAPGGDAPTAGAPGGDAAVADARTLPAGTDLDRLVGDRPTTQRRSRLRRRLRHLRRVRELLLRDLGGLMFEIHRSDAQTDRAHELVESKLSRLGAVDAELRELEDILGDRRGMVLREPGIGGSCPLCGELHGSDARFCWACGTPVAPGAVRPVVSAGSVPALGSGADAVETWTRPPEPAADAPTTPLEPVIEGEATADDAGPAAEEPAAVPASAVVVEPEPEPVAVPEPEPVADPEPEPVAEPEPEPVAAAEPDPEPWPATPEPEQPAPEPAAATQRADDGAWGSATGDNAGWDGWAATPAPPEEAEETAASKPKPKPKSKPRSKGRRR